MRNQYGRACYRCGQWCFGGDGHFQRSAGVWVVQHATCAIAYRGTTLRGVARPASRAEAEAIFNARQAAQQEPA